jgi:hypothetical protein
MSGKVARRRRGAVRPAPRQPRSRRRLGLVLGLAGAGAAGVGALLYAVRPMGVIHWPLLYWYTQPLVLLVPVPVAALVAWWAWSRRGTEIFWTSVTFIGAAFVVWIPVAIWSHVQMEKAIYRHSVFTELNALPERGLVRLLPKAIADQMVQSAVGTSGYTTHDGHIVLDPVLKRLVWTYEQAPYSVFNKLRRPTRGIVQLDAERTDRREEHADRNFKYAPGMHISQNTTWQTLKRHYLVEPTDPVGIVTPSGEPIFVAPYLRFEGFLPVRRPVVGGVLLYHPDGRIEDLSAEEAQRRPEIIASGRLVPEELARRIHDSYRFKNGALNTFFGHRDQTEVHDVDVSGNRMPYLMAFVERGVTHLKWVSVAKPHGRAFATKAIFLTDALTGTTEVWNAPKNADLTGPGRAIQTVLSLPGIVWSNFEVIEPRPAFVQGRLQFMFSVVPLTETANTVSKTVFVDAASNKVAAVFHHDDPAVDADAQVLRYLRTGRLDEPEPAPPRAGGGEPSGDPLIAALEQQLRDDRALAKKLAERIARLERLLEPTRDPG